MKYMFIILALILPFFAIAQNSVEAEPTDINEVKKRIQLALPGIEVINVTATPISGLYQVFTPGAINYVSADGRYLMTGSLIDQKEGVNVTESLMGQVRKDRLDQLGDDQMLVYKAKGKEKQVITVFTDTSCGYCRKLHQDIPTLNQEGVTVKYLLYPRMGPTSESAKIMESVWCAEKPLKAMDKAKANKYVSNGQCENPIQEHLRIGQEFGLRGTPMIITQTGDVLPGYYPPDALKAKIGLK